ncbi:hypothetical protein H6758_02895 [Candidatus Nomurabacteria bacterium]|nr:hypothetical protein [Candidatus Nomurabacteria bacterium]
MKKQILYFVYTLGIICAVFFPMVTYAEIVKCTCRVNIVQPGDLCVVEHSEVFTFDTENGAVVPIDLPLDGFFADAADTQACMNVAPPFDTISGGQTLQLAVDSCNVDQEEEKDGNSYTLNCFFEGQDPAAAPGAAAGAPGSGAAPASGGDVGKEGELRKLSLPNPLQEVNINRLIGRIIGQALGLLGSISLAVFVYGGFMFLTSAGNDDKVKKGTNAMLYAAVGVFLVLASYVILREVFTKVF